MKEPAAPLKISSFSNETNEKYTSHLRRRHHIFVNLIEVWVPNSAIFVQKFSLIFKLEFVNKTEK